MKFTLSTYGYDVQSDKSCGIGFWYVEKFVLCEILYKVGMKDYIWGYETVSREFKLCFELERSSKETSPSVHWTLTTFKGSLILFLVPWVLFSQVLS